MRALKVTKIHSVAGLIGEDAGVVPARAIPRAAPYDQPGRPLWRRLDPAAR